MRSIIRFSVDGEQDGKLRNKLTSILERHGYVLNRNVTATYEHGNISPSDLATTMQEFWQQACSPPGPGTIDHVWLYSDNPPSAAGPTAAL